MKPGTWPVSRPWDRTILGWIVVVDLKGTTGYRRSQSQALDRCAAVNAYSAASDVCLSSDSKVPLTGSFTGAAVQPLHPHNGIRAGLSAGAALSPTLWCDGGRGEGASFSVGCAA